MRNEFGILETVVDSNHCKAILPGCRHCFQTHGGRQKPLCCLKNGANNFHSVIFELLCLMN